MATSLGAATHLPQDCGYEEALRDSDTVDRVASLALDSGPGPSDPVNDKSVESTHIPKNAWRNGFTIPPAGHDHQLRYDSGTSQVWHSLLLHPRDLWTSSAALENEYAGTWNSVHWPEVSRVPEPHNAERNDRGIGVQMNHIPVPVMHGDHDQTRRWQADLHINHKSKLSQPTDTPTRSQTDKTLKDRKQLDIGKTPDIQPEDTSGISKNVPDNPLSRSEGDPIESTTEKHHVTGKKEKPEKHSIHYEKSSASTSLDSSNDASYPKPITFEITCAKGKKLLEEEEPIIATKSAFVPKRKNKKGSYFDTGKKVSTMAKGRKVIYTLSEEEKFQQQVAWRLKKKWDVQDVPRDRNNENPYIAGTSHSLDISKPIQANSHQDELPLLVQKELLPNPIIEPPLEEKKTCGVSQAKLDSGNQEEEATLMSPKEPFTERAKNGEKGKFDNQNGEKGKFHNPKHIGMQDKQSKLWAINLLNPGSDSPDMIPTSEEKHILDLIKNRELPKHFRLITKAGIRFDVEYDAQAQILNSEFQKFKASQRLQKLLPSPRSIMSSLEIELPFTKKIEQVYDDMISTPPKQGLKRTRLCDYSKSTVEMFFEIWGWEAVKSWERNRLDIQLMTQLALILNLEHKTSHLGISPMFGKTDLYDRFMIMYLEKKKFSKIVNSIYNIIGKEEGARRLEAFCKYLRYHTTAGNYALKRHTWFMEGLQKVHQVAYFDFQLGLSELPESQVELNPFPNWYGKKIEEKDLKDFLVSICGRTDAAKKLELRDYLKEVPHLSDWWLNVGLESAIRKFGIDLLKILKIGNALQFGFKDFLGDALIEDRIPTEDAFLTILNIMTDSGSLPWIESAERSWFYNFCGSFYQDRLRQLSHLVASRKLTLQTGRTHATGWALIWCDLGLNISEIPSISQSLESPVQIQQKIKKYENLSNYEKLAIAIWSKSLSAMPLSSEGGRRVKFLSPLIEHRGLPLFADKTKKKKGEDLHYRADIQISWKFFKDWARYSLSRS
ncbi:hypothetical protein Pst134EB_018753 [Puccinia striiformis f. sp. tritici]|nr:hypothetical protein Pst134EB_018753 [Puccinia striiformis f. sp. tritici]